MYRFPVKQGVPLPQTPCYVNISLVYTPLTLLLTESGVFQTRVECHNVHKQRCMHEMFTCLFYYLLP